MSRRAVDKPGNYDMRLRVGFSWLAPGEEKRTARKRRRRSRGWTRDRWLRHFLPGEGRVALPPVSPVIPQHGPCGHAAPPAPTPLHDLAGHYQKLQDTLFAERVAGWALEGTRPSPPSDWAAGITTVQACRTMLRDCAKAALEKGYDRQTAVAFRAASRILMHYMENALIDGLLEAEVKTRGRLWLDAMTKGKPRH